MHRLLSCLQLAATLLAVVALVAARHHDRTVCNAEGECQPFQFGQTEDEDLVVEAIHSSANDRLKNAMEALLHWTVTSTSDDAQPMEQWFAPDILVEAEGTPNVPWRGRYEGASAAAAFFLRLRQGLFPAPADNSTTGLQWATAAAGPGRFVVRWEPSHDTVADVDANVQLRRAECGAWLIGEESSTSGGRLARLQVHHTHSLACAAVFRSRAQRVFDAAFAHFFRLDYAAFRQSFDPDVTMTWHGDAPLGKVFRGNQDGLSDYIRTRVQIFLQTSVEFDPIIANETSASYFVVFRPLTIRATGQEFGEVRGLLVIHINEAGLIDSYQMTVLDRRVNLALAHAVKE